MGPEWQILTTGLSPDLNIIEEADFLIWQGNVDMQTCPYVCMMPSRWAGRLIS